MNNYNIKKIGEFPIRKLLQELSLNDFLWDFDAVSFYPSAMSDPESIYPRVETGYAFTPDMNDDLVENFIIQTFNQRSLKIKYYNAKNLIVQHLPVKEKEKKIEINCIRNGYIIQTLASIDIQKIVKYGGKVIESYEGVIHREIFKVSLFKKVIDKLFELRQK